MNIYLPCGFLLIVLSLYLFYYYNRKQKEKQEDRREERNEQRREFLNKILEEKKNKEERKDKLWPAQNRDHQIKRAPLQNLSGHHDHSAMITWYSSVKITHKKSGLSKVRTQTLVFNWGAWLLEKRQERDSQICFRVSKRNRSFKLCRSF